MEEAQLYSCSFPAIRQLYIIIILISVFSWAYFFKRNGLSDESFISHLFESFCFGVMPLGVLLLGFVFIFTLLDVSRNHLIGSTLHFFYSIDFCFFESTELKNNYTTSSRIPVVAAMMVLSIMLIVGLCTVVFDIIKLASFLPEEIGRFFKKISLHIALGKEKRKLKALRSEEAGKLNAVKLQLKSALETEQKTVEKTLSQLAAQRQRVAASRQKLMAKDMDQE